MPSKHEIKNLNEWSLEMAVMHELLDLAQSIWWYARPPIPRQHWSPNYVFPFLNKPKFALYKPAPAAEKKLGYDIHLKPIHEDAKALFLQFKRGAYGTGEKSITNSKFIVKNGICPKYYEFHINDNSGNDQHTILDRLANDNSIKQATFYALPRVASKDEYETSIGKLLLRTNFIPVTHVSAKAISEAKKAGLTFDWKKEHRILISDDGTSWELNFFFFFFYGDLMPELFTELVIHQWSLAYNHLQSLKDNVTTRSMQLIFSSTMLHLSYYLGVETEATSQLLILASMPNNNNTESGWRSEMNKRRESMTQTDMSRGLAIWKQLNDTLKLADGAILKENFWSLGEQLNAYKYSYLKSIKDDLKVTFPEGFTETDLSIYQV